VKSKVLSRKQKEAWIESRRFRRTNLPGKSSARCWKVEGLHFYIAVFEHPPIVIPKGLPSSGALVFGLTAKRRRWQIWTHLETEREFLVTYGLWDARFRTRRDATAALKLALKGVVA
jgi:hypothetical protein